MWLCCDGSVVYKNNSQSINLKMFLTKTLRLAWQFLSLWDCPYFINITAQEFSDRFCFSLVIPSINLCPKSSVHWSLEIWQQGLDKPQEFRQKKTVKLQEDLQTLDVSCSKQYHTLLQHPVPSCALLMLWQRFQFSFGLSWFLWSYNPVTTENT